MPSKKRRKTVWKREPITDFRYEAGSSLYLMAKGVKGFTGIIRKQQMKKNLPEETNVPKRIDDQK
jgi:hypothetical protein